MRWRLLPALLVISTTVTAAQRKQTAFVPKNGFVPDVATAIRIAEAVWIPIYGEEQIQSERPFEATLSNGVWTVTGHLPEGWRGGVAVAQISKEDGRILSVMHGK